jgi:hypothetical protein
MGLLIGNVSNSILPERVKEAVYEDIPMYGVKFPSDSTVGVRTYDAANLNWFRSDNTTAGIDDFKDLAPFNVKEVCRVWDGTTATYLYKSDYSDAEWQTIREGTHATIDGDIMIEVPEFWYRRVDTAEGLEIIIAPEYKVGFTPDPWHYEKGVHYQKRYISKYPIGSGYKIRSGIGLQVNTNMNTFRTNLRNKGLNMISAPAWYSLTMLMLVKYASTDAQATVSYGWAEGNTTHTTGSADNVLGLDGSATSVATNEGALTFGIESFYGDCWKFIDGCFLYDNVMYLKDVEDVTSDPTSLADLQASYTPVDVPVWGGGNKSPITSIANDTTYDWLFHPCNTSGSSKTIVCNDNFWSATGLRLLVLGGAAWSGSSAGVFCWNSLGAVGDSSVDYGGLAVC